MLAALSAGAAQIETGRAERVLVIGAEILSRVTNPDDKRTAALFGDGAGAVVLSRRRARARSARSCSPPTAGWRDTIVAAHEERFIHMDGHDDVQQGRQGAHASRRSEACERAGVTLDDIDLFVYHQANGRILRSPSARSSSSRAERVADYVGETGNTSAASIPLALSLLREDGRLRPGQRVLLGAVGAGFTWGAGVVEWGVR